MGVHTQYVGYALITPRLSEEEAAYLTAFSRSRRHDRPGGPFEVPQNPAAEWNDDGPVITDHDAYNRPGKGQPELWCPWAPCLEGCCLAWNGVEKPYAGEQWLRYLIATFLRPGATAARDTTGRFDGFTFDHRLDGAIVGCRQDTREVFALMVRANRVTRRVLVPGTSWLGGYGEFPSEEQERADGERRHARRERWLAAVATDGA